MMKTAQQEIEQRIAELEAEPPALVASDEGTHGGNLNHRIYETVTGERYGTASHAGSNSTPCPVESVYADTMGRVRTFQSETARIRGLQKELQTLRGQLD